MCIGCISYSLKVSITILLYRNATNHPLFFCFSNLLFTPAVIWKSCKESQDEHHLYISKNWIHMKNFRIYDNFSDIFYDFTVHKNITGEWYVPFLITLCENVQHGHNERSHPTLSHQQIVVYKQTRHYSFWNWKHFKCMSEKYRLSSY